MVTWPIVGPMQYFTPRGVDGFIATRALLLLHILSVMLVGGVHLKL